MERSVARGSLMRGELHHIELWVPDLRRAVDSLGWLLAALGYEPYQEWGKGRSWKIGNTYIVVEQSPALSGHVHDRCRPGVNHLAFHGGDSTQLDTLVSNATDHGWTLLFADRHPYAGGPDHHAGYLENSDGFEVELVAHHDRRVLSDDPSYTSAGRRPWLRGATDSHVHQASMRRPRRLSS